MQGHPSLPLPTWFWFLDSEFWTLATLFFRCARTLDSGFWTRSLDSALIPLSACLLRTDSGLRTSPDQSGLRTPDSGLRTPDSGLGPADMTSFFSVLRTLELRNLFQTIAWTMVWQPDVWDKALRSTQLMSFRMCRTKKE